MLRPEPGRVNTGSVPPAALLPPLLRADNAPAAPGGTSFPGVALRCSEGWPANDGDTTCGNSFAAVEALEPVRDSGAAAASPPQPAGAALALLPMLDCVTSSSANAMSASPAEPTLMEAPTPARGDGDSGGDGDGAGDRDIESVIDRDIDNDCNVCDETLSRSRWSLAARTASRSASVASARSSCREVTAVEAAAAAEASEVKTAVDSVNGDSRDADIGSLSSYDMDSCAAGVLCVGSNRQVKKPRAFMESTGPQCQGQLRTLCQRVATALPWAASSATVCQ